MKAITRIMICFVLFMVGITSCKQTATSNLTLSGLNPENFMHEIKGKKGELYTLNNKNGMEVCFTNIGARIVSIMVPDRNGEMKDVVLGFDNSRDYETIPTDFGATIGRYANRIANGKIVIDGIEYQLPRNNFGHCLHGGDNGWQYSMFDGKKIGDSVLEFSLVSPDGDENFPGKMNVKVRFELTDDNAIDIRYQATTDRKTVINMTNHSYFNLTGDPQKSAMEHILYLNANEYTPVDNTFMTTGEILPVEGTSMDFTTPKALSQDIDKMDFIQLKNGNGYDHNWVLNTKGNDKELAAKLFSPASGIILEVYTDEPGIQVYAGNFMDGTVTGKKGIVYNQRAAVCLETQHYPDSPNKPDWHSVILEPGETYTSRTVYKFLTGLP